MTSVQFTAAPDGRRLAVLDAGDWQGLLEWLEDVEDQRVVQVALDQLRLGQKRPELFRWRGRCMSYEVWIEPSALRKAQAAPGGEQGAGLTARDF